ncbi:sodium-coupled monocarboxylate transporter 1-like isoform X2 [Argopecten irradians]|uniref:sodium-coupled monocarboxylate transporter 1-like isoform X2 n=1 Tax=Argopecten irradians TaxID=31199 RepID=UPI0037248F34
MAFLTWPDYAIFIVTLIFSLGIGLFYSLRGARNKTTTQFILGDGNMWTFPVALSLMVSYESGIMMLGVPAEVYMYGMQWYMSILGTFIAQILTLILIIPSQKNLNITSMNQYFELRYHSHGIRVFATIIGLLARANYLGNVLFVPAVTLEMVAGIPMWASILTLTAVVVVYTIIGGFTAVIWTDVFQAVLMFGAMFATLIKGTIEAGGLTNTWSLVKEKGRLNMLDMYFIAAVLALFIAGLAVMEGAIMFAYYQAKGCDPLEANQVRNENQLIAKLVRDIFHDTPCLPGLFLAALFSASLSTMSSVLSAMSAMFWEDIVKPHTKPMSDKRAMRVAQSSVLLFGVLAVFVAFGISGIDGPVSRILDITGACLEGAVAGLFILGWFNRRANVLGALVGASACVVVVGWISFGKLVSPGVRVHPKLEPASIEHCPIYNVSGIVNTTTYEQLSQEAMFNYSGIVFDGTSTPVHSEPQGLDLLYSLSYKWLAPLGICLVVIIGSIVSRFKEYKSVDPGLVVPLYDYLRCCSTFNPCRKTCKRETKYTVNGKANGREEAEAMIDMTSDPARIKGR